MSISLIRAGVVAALLLPPSPLWAADENGKFAVDGVGARACSDFSAVKGTTEGRRAFASWAEGFVTAYNIYTEATFDVTPWQPAELLMLKMGAFCKANPDVPFVNGLSALIHTLEKERVTQEDSFVRVRNGDRSVYIYTRSLEKLRVDLIAAGFDAGPAGAPYEQAFEGAVRAFQASKGLNETGLPDAPSMNAMYP